MLNYDFLESQIDYYAKSFASAKPHKHLIFDEFLDPEVALEAFSVFPKMEEMDSLQDFRQNKAQDPAIDKFDPIFSEIIFQHLHSQRFLKIISKISGISDLVADPKLYSSGLAQGTNGSYLNVHIDNSSHPVTKQYRRLNLILYLNKEWTEEKGGHFELWSPNMSESTAIIPSFNRAMIFATHRESWHGYRHVNTPDGDTRKSINLFYFNEESPDGTDYYHVSSFRARKNEGLNKILYPVDNLARTIFRLLRPKKDGHAVLFDKEPLNSKDAHKKTDY